LVYLMSKLPKQRWFQSHFTWVMTFDQQSAFQWTQ
jgi:hypothetical protein